MMSRRDPHGAVCRGRNEASRAGMLTPPKFPRLEGNPQDVAEDLGPVWVALRVGSRHPIALARVLQCCQHGGILSQSAMADLVGKPAIHRASASAKGGHPAACVSECGNHLRAGRGRRQSGAEQCCPRLSAGFVRHSHDLQLPRAEGQPEITGTDPDTSPGFRGRAKPHRSFAP